jgi:CDP-glycerol glycerophosphotransferase
MSGHLFNGNLLVFYDRVGATADGWEFRYVYIDFRAYRMRDPGHVTAWSSQRPDHMVAMARADVVMTDHAPGVWRLLQILRPGIAFVDVWHGVGFKPLGNEYGRKMAGYRALFASSDWDAREGYIADGGASPDQVVATGYARADPLLDPVDRDELADRYGLPPAMLGRVLVALTWDHGEHGRQILPFGLDADDFLGRLDAWAADAKWTVLLRSHLNTVIESSASYPNVRFVPLAEYPRTFELLMAADVLVTDWSSIASEFLVLDRPIIFIDREPPFPATRLTAAERVGYLTEDWDGFVAALDTATTNPEDFRSRFADRRHTLLEKIFGSTLDGRSSERYLDVLNRLVEKERP